MSNQTPQCADRDEDASFALAMTYDAGLAAARAGAQELQACFSDLPFSGCPEHWTDLPFARIVWREERGDRNVGIPDVSGWCLAPDQAGTIVAQLAALEGDCIDGSGAPTPTVQQVLDDPAASNWLKAALQAAVRRDPVDAANEAEVLARALAVHAEGVLARAGNLQVAESTAVSALDGGVVEGQP
jgi:hypothetical protein